MNVFDYIENYDGELALVDNNAFKKAVAFIKSKMSKEDYQTLKDDFNFDVIEIKKGE